METQDAQNSKSAFVSFDTNLVEEFRKQLQGQASTALASVAPSAEPAAQADKNTQDVKVPSVDTAQEQAKEAMQINIFDNDGDMVKEVSAQVKVLQKAVNESKIGEDDDIKVDGIIGRETLVRAGETGAIKGIVELDDLQSISAKKFDEMASIDGKAAETMDNPEFARVLQITIERAGGDLGPSGADGDFGPTSIAAAKEIGLVAADGTIDLSKAKALDAKYFEKEFEAAMNSTPVPIAAKNEEAAVAPESVTPEEVSEGEAVAPAPVPVDAASSVAKDAATPPR